MYKAAKESDGWRVNGPYGAIAVGMTCTAAMLMVCRLNWEEIRRSNKFVMGYGQ